MANFPSKWLDFTTNKEIKRLRKDVNDTLSLKIEISVSIILTIIAFCFSEYIGKMKPICQTLVCISMCLIILVIFFYPCVKKYLSQKKHCNIIIEGRDAVSIFDEEIVYNVLVAAEYHNSKINLNENQIKQDLLNFYDIEIRYYLLLAIEQLLQFNVNKSEIFGDKKNQISTVRVKNILALINSIIKDSQITIDKTKLEMFKDFCTMFE